MYKNLYANVSYTFTTDPQNPDTLVYNGVEDIEVPEGSLYVDVRVRTQFDNLSFLPPAVKDLVENLSETLDVERTLTATLFKPDNEVFHSRKYDGTTFQMDQWPKVSSPQSGTWHLEIEAEGIGGDVVGYHDNFDIHVIVRAPA